MQLRQVSVWTVSRHQAEIPVQVLTPSRGTDRFIDLRTIRVEVIGAPIAEDQNARQSREISAQAPRPAVAVTQSSLQASRPTVAL
jgi:hypothetical protein